MKGGDTMKISPVKQIKDGLVVNNPIFVQFLGMCSALAITTSITNAVGMGLSVTAVLICSNVLISLLRRFIVPQIRIAAFIVIISGFVTAVELLIKAYLPELNKSLGLFIPLIVVNCIILARAESFASKNGVFASAVDGFAMGLGYTAAVVVTAAVRELLGTGKLLAAADGSGGITILGDWYSPANIFILPPGAFLTLAFLCALFQKLRTVSAEKKALAAADGEKGDASEYEEVSGEDADEADDADVGIAEAAAPERLAAEADTAAVNAAPEETGAPDATGPSSSAENVTGGMSAGENSFAEELAEDMTAGIAAEPGDAPASDDTPAFDDAPASDDAPAIDIDVHENINDEITAPETLAADDTAGDNAGDTPADSESGGNGIITDDPVLAALMENGFDDDGADGAEGGENR